MQRVWLEIKGMSCEHCVRAVTQALRDLPGVHEAEVSLERGGARITADDTVSEADLRAAVEEAGYDLVSVREEGAQA